MASIDFTDTLDRANMVTSNAASVIRGAIDAGEAGVELVLANLAPLAVQLDELFGNHGEPVPAAPEGGVPADGPVAASDAEAAAAVGVTGQ